MVVPSNFVIGENGKIILDGDFAKYLRAYLDAFDSVTVACPAAPPGSFPTLEALDAIEHDGRLRIILLPEPYREDRYLLARGKVKALLRREIAAANVILIAPHSAFDWPTLAADICIAMGKKYNMEGDWNLQQVSRHIWRAMPFGPNKLRKYLWMKHLDPRYFRALRHSAVALLHGHDVYEAYKDIAPNPHSVNNFRLTQEDRIGTPALDAKLAAVRDKACLDIVYAGRAIDMKGPEEWLRTLAILKQRNISFRATWFGDGDRLEAMQASARDHGLDSDVRFAGKQPRAAVREAVIAADIFLFCHMTRESPRNLVEALAWGTPIVGFRSPYSESLIAEKGGGLLVDTGDTGALAAAVERLANDRPALVRLIEDAAVCGRQFDRDAAVGRRIALMKRYLLDDPQA